ncbi:MAG TPA: methyltransferase domain-containing protein [Herpetosiphonaceae bacterium]
MTFDAYLTGRNAADYADFLIPHLAPDVRLLDVGCGGGSISVGLARLSGNVIGVDLDAEEFADARQYAMQQGMTNVEFRVGSVYALDFPAEHFDACLCHSMLETLDRPLDALEEIKRTLKPGAVLGVACVEYGGLILAGPNEQLLRRFYTVRERLWQLDTMSDPYRGRALRGLLRSAGFERVVASSKYFCYGTDDAVKSFGRARAADCRDEWYASAAQTYGLASASDLDAMEYAWMEWSESATAYAAFAWCRAIGWKP